MTEVAELMLASLVVILLAYKIPLAVGMGIEKWLGFQIVGSIRIVHSELIDSSHQCRHVWTTVEHCKTICILAAELATRRTYFGEEELVQGLV